MKDRLPDKTVSAAELVRSFAVCRDRATLEPLMISNHGRPTHVLMGIEQFRQLSSAGAGRGMPVGPAEGDQVRELADWMDDAVMLLDRDLRVLFANRVAHAVCRVPSGSLNGTMLLEALPNVSGTLLEVHARRTAVSSEPSAADLPSPFVDSAWLRAQTFPVGDRIVMVFRDISEDVQRHRLADVKNALLHAMDVHGGIGYVRASLRGTIERVDAVFCAMLDLPEARLLNVQLVDLLTAASRPLFRESLDAVLRGAGSRRVRADFLSNRGTTVAVVAAMAQLHGAYGAEGAVVLMTPVNRAGEIAA